MDLLMNGLLMAASLFAGGYCWVLARRVRDLKSLDKGLGAGIVTLTRQIELARVTLEEARASSRDTRQELSQLVAKADAATNQLRLLLAATPKPAPAAPLQPTTVEPQPKAAPAAEPIAPVAPATALSFAEIPKPRALARVENPLRRAKGESEPARSEDDIIETLRQLAGGS
jgi:hypothetical protein